MTRIKDESVERVKATMEILPLVEDVVRLRKAGGTYKGLCPFHQERTPSFTVSPARGTFKCFGCGEGGDAITFVEKIENVDFVGAIELLARRFGVELEYEEASPEQEEKRRRDERLRALLERAAEFYGRVLWESEAGAGARGYLASRGLGEEVCREFRLGYAPGGARLASRALQEGYTQEELLAVGLANRRGNDYFQRRILFPLADRNGRVRGFQARKVHDDDPLPPGTDPADDPTAFQGRLASPVSYPVHRVRLEHARARDKESAWAAILAFLNGLPDSPEHMEARRAATDLLDLPPETQGLLAP